MPHSTAIWDCLVVGGGPAGLTTALYLARYRRNVLVLDAGKSRALKIPSSHNHPGFHGIKGSELLEKLSSQARRYGAIFKRGEVTSLERESDLFRADLGGRSIMAARVVLATGLTDHDPPRECLHNEMPSHLVRYCPICDGYEAIDRRIAVYGGGDAALKKALFLRTFSRDVTLLPTKIGDPKGSAEIKIVNEPPRRFIKTAGGIAAELQSGARLEFDLLYPALGCDVHSDLAKNLGATLGDAGCVVVDAHQQTTISGLYAAGDVVSDLHQITVAEGHAAIAATSVHNGLPRNSR